MAPAPAADPCINVLMTGFGPFSSAKERNPSWEAVKLVAERGCDFDVIYATCDAPGPDAKLVKKHKRVHLDISYMPVEYDAVLDRMPRFHGRRALSSGNDESSAANSQERDDFDQTRQYHLYLHVGQGAVGGIKLETLAHVSGYKSADVAGKFPPPVKAAEHLTVTPHERTLNAQEKKLPENLGYPLAEELELLQGGTLQTSLDTHMLATRLSTAYPGISIQPSTNAGRYLCEYIYFASMAEAALAARQRQEGASQVLFVHVPPPQQPLSIEQMADVLQEVIKAICETL